jgi:hypothetical protein
MPYTYLLRNKITGERYYGVRYALGCDPAELWVSYFSSSGHVSQRIKEHGLESFEFEVRRVFSEAKQARDWEERVLRRLDVLHRADWLNQNVCGKFLVEGPQSEEHKKHRAEAMEQAWARGAFAEVDFCHTEEERKATSVRFKGVPKTEEHKAKLPYLKLNQQTVECPQCHAVGQYVNMKRWHFENCKTLGVVREQRTCPNCGHTGTAPNIFRFHFTNCKEDAMTHRHK